MKARLSLMMDTTKKRTGAAILCVVLFAIVGTGAVLISRNGGAEDSKTLDGVPIPSHILADEAMIVEYSKPRDVMWHVYQEEDGYEWYAIHYWRERDGQELEEWTIRGLSTTADEQKSWAFGSGFEVEDKVFYGNKSEGFTRNGGARVYKTMATGIVNDPQVATVVGTTANGRTASATPVNTCWYLILADIGEVDEFTSVQALDEAGNVLHALDFGKRPVAPGFDPEQLIGQ